MTVPKYVSSFAAGFLFGAGLALMLTPVPGKKMQKKVGKVADAVLDKVEYLKVAAMRMAS
jgi:hypothetical protein